MSPFFRFSTVRSLQFLRSQSRGRQGIRSTVPARRLQRRLPMLGVRRFEDLDVHQLAVQLRREIVRITSTGVVTRDHKFVVQIRNAARGGPRNIAEGFARVVPGEFFHFLSYARASIAETKNHLDDGQESGYFSDSDCNHIKILIRRTQSAISSLMRYLDSPAAARAYEGLREKRRAPARSNDAAQAQDAPTRRERLTRTGGRTARRANREAKNTADP